MTKQKTTLRRNAAALKISLRLVGHRVPTGPRMRLLLAKAAKAVRVRTGHWDITLVSDEAMCELHGRTMGIPTTTDVLTFDLGEPVAGIEKRQRIDLDTVICFDEACRRGIERGHNIMDEVLLYAVHSLLHVVGYDDVTPAKFRAMHKREDEILIKLGVGPVFKKQAAGRKRGGGGE